MKKMLSMALALVMVSGLSIPAFAAAATPGHGSGSPSYSTTVEYVGQATEEYIVTVPAQLAPAGSDDVVATGTWNAAKTLTVTAPTSVTLTYGEQSKDLAVTFEGISQVGSNTESINVTKSISVADFAAGQAPLFGTWTGTITYSVGLA